MYNRSECESSTDNPECALNREMILNTNYYKHSSFTAPGKNKFNNIKKNLTLVRTVHKLNKTKGDVLVLQCYVIGSGEKNQTNESYKKQQRCNNAVRLNT